MLCRKFDLIPIKIIFYKLLKLLKKPHMCICISAFQLMKHNVIFPNSCANVYHYMEQYDWTLNRINNRLQFLTFPEILGRV